MWVETFTRTPTRHHPECQQMGKYERNIYREKLCCSCENLVDRRRNHTGKRKNVNLAEQVTFFPESKFYESSARVARQKSKINFYAFFPLLVPRPITTSRGRKRKQKSICNIKHKRLRFDGIAALFMHRAWPLFRMHLKWFFWHFVPRSSDLSNRDIVEGTLS